ncbi:MAG TPA: hypothetical protein VKV31_00570 [bacterium]|nr:hypothetical protein [bacterium]
MERDYLTFSKLMKLLKVVGFKLLEATRPLFGSAVFEVEVG